MAGPRRLPPLARLGLAVAMVAPALMLGAFAQPVPEPAPETPMPYTLPSMAPAGAGPKGSAAITTAWTRSGHADAGSESFAHWNEDGAIPGICATCHSGQGFRALYGLDGSAPGVPEHPLPTGGVVDCATCHHPRLSEVTEVRLPTGAMHLVGASEATCLTCHQGRASGQGVDAAVERAGSTGDDTPNPELGFVNPHYAIAAATWLGGYGGLGYQYPGKDYEGRFLHAPAVATCTSCHDPHGLQVAQDTCLTCHQSGDPKAIRITRQSHDGSGDTAKGIHADIAANARLLLEMVADYAAEVSGTPILYDALRHPYFFADANGDGVADQSGGAPVAYGAWTPRLLRAAYNWKFVGADTGAHVHNPHYALELLYDSIEDLSGALGRDFGALGLVR